MATRRPPGKSREFEFGVDDAEPRVLLRSDSLGLLQRLIGVCSCFLLGVLAGTNLGSEPAAADLVAAGSETARVSSSSSQLGSGKWKRMHFYVGPEWTLGQRGQLHSQCGQDWLVLSMLGCKRNGFFLDLAANDARVLSNTLLLERDFGWSGICIEANTEYAYGLARRRCQLVFGAAGAPSDQEVTFNLHGVGGGIVGSDMDNKEASSASVTLRTVSVMEILERRGAPHRMDFFSLDVEGAESLVMAGFDWSRYRFSIVVVERPKDDLKQAMMHAGYKVIRNNARWGDYTWVDSTLPDVDLLSAIWANHPEQSLPPSCMDNLGYYQPVGAHWRETQYQEAMLS